MDLILNVVEECGDYVSTPDVCIKMGGAKQKDMLKLLNGLVEQNLIMKEKRGTTLFWKFIHAEPENAYPESAVAVGASIEKSSDYKLYLQIIENQRSEILFLRRENEIKNEHIKLLLNMRTNTGNLEIPNSPSNIRELGVPNTPVQHALPAEHFHTVTSHEPFHVPRKAAPVKVTYADNLTAQIETRNRFSGMQESAEKQCCNGNEIANSPSNTPRQKKHVIYATPKFAASEKCEWFAVHTGTPVSASRCKYVYNTETQGGDAWNESLLWHICERDAAKPDQC